MLRGLRFAVIACMATGSVLGLPGVAQASSLSAQPVGIDLNYPAAFTFAPGGLIYYAERTTGRVAILDPATGTSRAFFTVPGAVSMLGLAVHPNYPDKPYVYVYGTRDIAGVQYDQLLRITNHKGSGVGLKVLLSRRAAPPEALNLHDGGRLEFGPDGFLYLVIGDLDDPSHSQDLSDVSGKLLRMTPSGGPAPGNPIAKSRVYASGIRNSFGYDFDPETGRLWLGDNGPECNDELDLIVKGSNYGWGPSETCTTPPAAPQNTNQDGPSPVLPEFWWATPIAPTGVAFCEGCGLGTGTDGSLFFGDDNFFGNYTGGAIHEVTLDPERDDVVSESAVYIHTHEVLSLEVGPDGAIYFSDAFGIYRLVSS